MLDAEAELHRKQDRRCRSLVLSDFAAALSGNRLICEKNVFRTAYKRIASWCGSFAWEAEMEERIAMLSIIIEDTESIARMNSILHEYSENIIGRMGIPYRDENLYLISIAIDAPMDKINTLTGRLGRLPGVSAKAVYAKRS